MPKFPSALKTLLDPHKFHVVIERLSHQLIENHLDFSQTVLIGIQPRGVFLSDRVVAYLRTLVKSKLEYGKLDITFYRDDFNTGGELHIPSETVIDFSIDDKNVVLIDDVLFTGRTIRSAMDAILDFGRPRSVELMTLIDRRFSRELPIQADYVGMMIDSLSSQKVKVCWKERDGKDEVVMITNEK